MPSIISTERFIIAATVDALSETRIIAQLFDQAQRTTQRKKATILMDKNYHSIAIAKAAADRGCQLLSPRTRPNRNLFNKTEDFERLEDGSGYRCPNGKILKRGHTKTTAAGKQSIVFTAKSTDCGACDLKDKCTTAKRRSVHESIDEQYLIDLRARMEVEENKALYKKRSGCVEPVFSALKENQNLTRFHRKGLLSVKTEFVLHACAYNLRQVAIRRMKAFFAFLESYIWMLSALKTNYKGV